MCRSAAALAPQLLDAHALGVLLTGLARCLRPRPHRPRRAAPQGEAQLSLTGASEPCPTPPTAVADELSAGSAGAAGASGTEEATVSSAVDEAAAAAEAAPVLLAAAGSAGGQATGSKGGAAGTAASVSSRASRRPRLLWEGLDTTAASALGSAVGTLLVAHTRQGGQQPAQRVSGGQRWSSSSHPPGHTLPLWSPPADPLSSPAAPLPPPSPPAPDASLLNAQSLTMVLWGAARLRLPLTARQKEAALAATRQLLLAPGAPSGAGTRRPRPGATTPGTDESLTAGQGMQLLARSGSSGMTSGSSNASASTGVSDVSQGRGEAAAAQLLATDSPAGMPRTLPGGSPGGLLSAASGSGRGAATVAQLVVCCWALQRLGCQPGARWRQDAELAAEHR